jgi:hypothetical protein
MFDMDGEGNEHPLEEYFRLFYDKHNYFEMFNYSCKYRVSQKNSSLTVGAFTTICKLLIVI